jgi:hypothetical protein
VQATLRYAETDGEKVQRELGEARRRGTRPLIYPSRFPDMRQITPHFAIRSSDMEYIFRFHL